MTAQTRSRSTNVAIVALAFCVIGLIARTIPLHNLVDLIVAVASPYTALIAFFALLMFMARKRKGWCIAATATVIATATVQFQWHLVGTPAGYGNHITLRILGSNLRKGQADPKELFRIAQRYADVLAVSELTPEITEKLATEGIDESFPFSIREPEHGAGGIGLWSRYPLVAIAPENRQKTTIAAAQLRIPGLSFSPVVASLHVTSPITAEAGSFRRWRDGIAGAKANLDRFAETAGRGAVVVAGDFNSTPDMRQFRDLCTNGYRDAVEQTGSGFAPTFPSGSWHPPLITIDHVLIRGAAASEIRTVSMSGSDHRAILASVHLPVTPPAT